MSRFAMAKLVGQNGGSESASRTVQSPCLLTYTHAEIDFPLRPNLIYLGRSQIVSSPSLSSSPPGYSDKQDYSL